MINSLNQITSLPTEIRQFQSLNTKYHGILNTPANCQLKDCQLQSLNNQYDAIRNTPANCQLKDCQLILQP